MVAITTLSTGDQGWALDDATTRRPWPIAADANGYALITPPANYRVAATDFTVTRAVHNDGVAALASSVSGRFTGSQIRPFIASYQTGLSRVTAIFRLDIVFESSQFSLHPRQYSITPNSGLVRDTSSETFDSSNRLRLRPIPPSIPTTNIASNADAADNFISLWEEDYDGVWGRPRLQGSRTYGIDAAGNEIQVQPGISYLTYNLLNANSRGDYVRLTATRIAPPPGNTHSNSGATLPLTIPSRSLQQCDIIADPAQTTGNAAFAVVVDGGQAVIYHGTTLVTVTPTTATEVARVNLPNQRNSYSLLDNVYLAVNDRYIWVLVVRRRIIEGRPTFVYQRLDRSNNQWLPAWIDLIPQGTLTWGNLDFVPQQFGLTRVPHGDTLAISITHALQADVNNRTYLITDRATGPRQPVIVRPATDHEVLNVDDPLIVGWTYNDPSGSTQRAYRLRRRIGSTDSYWAPGLSAEQDYIQWRQYDSPSNPGTLLSAIRRRGVTPLAVGSGSNTNNDDDNGTPTRNNVSVVRVIRARVKAGQTVSHVRWRSASTGVDRIIWHGLFPSVDGQPNLYAAADGAAEETMTTTSRWTSSRQTLTNSLAAGTEFFIVGAGWVDDITTKSVDFEVSFNDGTSWYGDLAAANDTRVEFLEWEWGESSWAASTTAATLVDTSSQQATIPEDWATAGGEEWQVAVTVWNQDNDRSAESAIRTLRPGGAAPPTISSPVASAVIQSLQVQATWTVANQSRFALWLEDSGGVAVTSRAPTTSTDIRTASVIAPRVGAYTLVLATWSSTGYRSEVRQPVTVAHTTAITVPVCAVATPASATYIRVNAGNIHSSADYWRVWRRERGKPATTILLWRGRELPVSDREFEDYSVANNVEYEYAVEVVDEATYGTNISSFVR